jgi:hypothetical protein
LFFKFNLKNKKKTKKKKTGERERGYVVRDYEDRIGLRKPMASE